MVARASAISEKRHLEQFPEKRSPGRAANLGCSRFSRRLLLPGMSLLKAGSCQDWPPYKVYRNSETALAESSAFSRSLSAYSGWGFARSLVASRSFHGNLDQIH
jgi:hypothetical protein